MVKSTSLSSDIDLIREFEELKLKQKLLISSLSKKKSTEEDKLLISISNKLDFLVKIFQESNKEGTEEDEESELEKRYQSLFTKLDSMQENFNKKVEELSATISKLDKHCEKVEENKINSSAPNPDFKVDEKVETLEKKENIKTEGIKKDKKGWFK